jgi:hypothetical protein
MTDVNLAAPCGLYCGTCECLGVNCQGCGHQMGKPFWAAQFNMEICPLYDCSANKKEIEHCGMCNDLPCEIFISLRDPSLSDEEFEKSLAERQENLRRRKQVGTEKWLEEKS